LLDSLLQEIAPLHFDIGNLNISQQTMVLFRVSHTTRVVSCKQCKVKLVRGELSGQGAEGCFPCQVCL